MRQDDDAAANRPHRWQPNARLPIRTHFRSAALLAGPKSLGQTADVAKPRSVSAPSIVVDCRPRARVEGPAVDFYHCWKNYNQDGKPESGFRHFIRHERFGQLKTADGRATIEANCSWIVNETIPVLDEHRTVGIVALGSGEYLLDLAWELKASRGDVRFLSDAVHYAWPYLRIHPQFSGEKGGTITNDQGDTGQEGTNGNVAKWIDYSNTVEGATEGLAVFIYPDGETHKWLTREYGTFGPRRPDKLSGSKYVLKKGDSVQGRVGILIHRGDVQSGQVSQRYQQYIEGKL